MITSSQKLLMGAAGVPSGGGPWDVGSASFLQSFSVSAQDNAPYGLFFKPDGTKLYIVGNSNDAIYEYNLSTAWDISTASYAQNFIVASQDGTPSGLFFKPDGTKMYISGLLGRRVYEYNLSTAWDISTAAFLQNLSVSSQDDTPTDVFFKPDGTKMYVLGATNDNVNEYDLSTAWNISTASFLQSLSVTAQETAPYGFFFKPDGTKMYVCGLANDSVNEYNLSAAWDVSTASYLKNFSVSAQDGLPIGIFFRPDGAKLYVNGLVGRAVNEYDIG